VGLFVSIQRGGLLYEAAALPIGSLDVESGLGVLVYLLECM
jgi:hypothetical protein